MSIRSKLLIALLVFSGFAAGIGAYAVYEIRNTVSLTVETYNKPFMSVNFSRAALNAFLNMEKALAHIALDAEVRPTAAWRAEMERQYQLFHEDMEVALERSPSAKATATMESLLRRVAEWNALRRAALEDGIDEDEWTALDRAGAAIFEEFNFLADQIAGDGFILRQNAIGSIEQMRSSAIVAVAMVMAIALMIAWLLGRAISRPLRQAVAVAERISQGELTAEIPRAGRDEAGVLLDSLSSMQRNLRSIMAREEALRKSAQVRLADAVEKSPEGVALLDSDYRIVIANTQISAIFADIADSFAAEADFFEALGEASRRGLMSVTDCAGLTYCCCEASAGGQAISDIEMSDGRWLRFRFSRAREAGVVVICVDITDIIRREAQLKAAKEEAEGASKAKTEFLANMSHELRTPLNAVIGFSQMLKDEVLGPIGDGKYRDYAADIHNSGNHLLSIISDILDLSKIEAGKMTPDLGQVDPRACVSAAIRILAPRAEERAVALSQTVGEAVGPVRADERMLKQVLMNLLSNAVKFTPAGGEVSVSAAPAPGGLLRIAIRDTGIGMSEEQIRIAGEPFGQVDSSLGRKYEGTGLGLPLARRMVELQGGGLSIRSRPGEGTEVAVDIPLADGDALPAVSRVAELPERRVAESN